MSIRVMIVEDDFIIRMFIEKVVQNAGFEIVAKASCFEDAVKLALEVKPNIILMDIGLSSKRDGIDAATAIHQKQEVKVVYLTGNSDEKTIERAKNTKPLGIIYKPINEESLISELQNYIKKSF